MAANGPLDNKSGSERDKIREASAKELLNRQLATGRKSSKVQ